MSSNKRNIERRAAEQAAKEQPRPGESTLRMWEDLTSPYSAKLRAWLNYKQIPWRRMRTSFEVYMQRIPELVGMPIIPIILTPDDEVLQDTTPMMTWLEERHPDPVTIPPDPRLALLHWIVEDAADEYLPRFSMHYRWGNDI
jgi:glutathione S-transferase